MSKNLRIRTKSVSTNVRGRRVGRACLELLEKKALVDDAAIENTFYNLEVYIVDPGVDLDELITEMESVPHLLEFVLSGINDYPFSVLHDSIMQAFPTTPDAFESSRAARLLNRFSLSLLFLPPGAATDNFAQLSQHRRAVELAVPVLQSLSGTTFVDDTAQDDDATSPSSPTFPTKRRSQQKRKQSMRATRVPLIDARPFDNYGVTVPASKSQACELAAIILEEQMNILKYFLDIFRNPSLVSVFKTQYLPPPPPESQDMPAPATSTHASPDDDITHAPEAGAYPFVQPMKAALYFDSAKGFGQWRILIGNGASQYLRQARKKDPSTFRIIINKIKALSNGHFSDDNHKKLTGSEVEVPIFEAKMTRDTRLVYQVDCVPEFQSNVERQVIRIFGIYTHGQIGRLVWQGMGWQVARKGAEYVNRCNFRKSADASRGDVFLPGSWPPVETETTPTALPMPNLVKEDLDEMHSLLVLEKFVTFSQALLNGILADEDITHVFDVSPKEKQIIEHPSSCYVLGRSGTGKTTTMLFKMLGIERSWEDFRDNLPKPRQMFVTQSRVLAEKVEEYFANLHRSLLVGKQTKDEVVRKSAQQVVLVDKDEEDRHHGDSNLPKRFGALTDEHFPIFLTFDQVCRLLENEYLYEHEERQRHETVSRAIDELMEFRDFSGSVQTRRWSSEHIMKRQNSFVSETKFVAEYWPHLRTKGLDPSFVFAEFIGIIKGSEKALARPEGYLDQETYCESRRSQTISADQRESIYRSFQAYLKRKAEREEWDAADRSHALIKSLRGGVPGQAIDFMYVDEAQDNLLIDSLILRNLCRNPHGMFWAGDTAQTISAGSAFRFNDLKAFMYRLEKNTITATGAKQVQPESFQLAVNYRSHAGIVNCAHTVIELLTTLWPYAIDNLTQEKGIVDGLKPVFFSGWDQDTARYEQFLFGESGSRIEFGAQQCILVRNDTAREKLRSQVGREIGLIFTIYEAKGLEFNDVLLYNFFEDSTADVSQWRVVLNALPPREHVPAPSFDEIRHNIICRELKFLYVAITRARKNLWIADSSAKGEPMRTVWNHKGQLETCTPGSDIPQLAMSSTPEEWAAMALSLFNNKRYAQAMHCYERADLSREKAVAYAYHLREQARAAPVNARGGALSQADAYILAAEAFLISAHDAVVEKSAYYRIAAECFAFNGDHARAAEAYQAAAEYDLAAQHYRQAGKFEQAVEVIKSHRAKMDTTVVETITEVSKLYFLREQQVEKARELFETDEDALEYMDDFGLDTARATLLEQLGKYSEAADLLFEEGNTLEALRVLALDHGNEHSVNRAVQVILAGLWDAISFGVIVSDELLKQNLSLRTLLDYAHTIGMEGLHIEETSLDELHMFQAITRQDHSKLVEMANKFCASDRLAQALLCLDHVFSMPIQLLQLTLPEVATNLQNFLSYVRLLQAFSYIPHPTDNFGIRKLLHLHAITEDHFVLPKDAYLITRVSERLISRFQTTDRGYIIPRWELNNIVQFGLQERLLQRVNEENVICRRLSSLRPCLPYAAYLPCPRDGCPRYHGELDYYGTAAYNIRVRIHLLQMLIYRTLDGVDSFPNRIHQMRFWLRQLHATMIPGHHNLGGLHALSADSIPELQMGLALVKLWVQDVLYYLEPWRAADQYLTQLLQCARLAFILDFRLAVSCMDRVRCVTEFRPVDLMRKHGDMSSYVVHDMLKLLDNSDDVSLNRGFLFVKHVIEQRVPIDITALCDLLDHLCGCVLLATRGRSRGVSGSLDKLTLPKSWLLDLMPHVHCLPSRKINLSFIYSRNIAELLEQIYMGAAEAGHLLFERTNLSKVSYLVRDVFLVRIFNNLCFWGYNISAFGLRNEILQTITSLRQPGRRFSPVVEEYVSARFWDQLAKTVRRSVSGESSSDELVQLHYGALPNPAPSLPDIRHVAYQRVEDIPRLLNADALNIFDAVSSGPTHPPTDVSYTTTQASSVPAPSVDDADQDDDVGGTMDPDGNLEEFAREIYSSEADAGPKVPSANEFKAASTLAAAYRRRISRQTAGKRKPLEEIKQRIYAAFLAEAQRAGWSKSYYRLLFLGPVPHLFVVVEAMKNHLYNAKNNAKKRLNFVQHLELETMRSSLTEITRRFKKACALHDALKPTSNMHAERDVQRLVGYTREAAELLKEDFSASTMSEWKVDMDIAMRGIVEVKKVVKPKKPELQLDDDMLMPDDDSELLSEY
ncbi:hypothetical protein L226DRAFT_576154 [Lentinus tigrinus ALCF2SS1-7]|uniref:UvrD-like helicase ATP-binding domain-containing protein n=1 Tax=Lentinus tigrinus ALCF2SS1-6 TaxID=1328759 RepID=A0A5C2S887_9APHY|nr:hypothetical protein L227DRAFT_527331 [Lentinus tigrinus ALCF2SS1-6]RPD68762.1 hypothetical protein L226DRAFT_576154 [Lentinus tigrinus ALCF2SS1-7]